jgi:hypothetical protein
MREVTAKEILEKISKGLPIENCIVKEKVDTTTLGEFIAAKILIKDSVFENFSSPSIEYCENVSVTNTTFLQCTFNYAYLKGVLPLTNAFLKVIWTLKRVFIMRTVILF